MIFQFSPNFPGTTSHSMRQNYEETPKRIQKANSQFPLEVIEKSFLDMTGAEPTLPCRISTIPVLINFKKMGPPLTAYLVGCFYSFFNFWS